MIKLRRWSAIAVLTGIAFALAACGGDEKEVKPPAQAEGTKAKKTSPTSSGSAPTPQPSPPPAARDEIRYAGETESGDAFEAQFGGEVTLPRSFGADLPAYPGSTPTSAMETGGGTAMAALDSDASLDEILGFYREKLTDGGWSIGGDNEVGRGRILTATKGDRQVIINAETTDAGSRITLSISPQG